MPVVDTHMHTCMAAPSTTKQILLYSLQHPGIFKFPYSLRDEISLSLGSRSSGVYGVPLHLASESHSTVCRNGKKPALGRFRGAR